VEPRYEVLDLGHEYWALEGHFAKHTTNGLVVLVELDRESVQGLDILMQAVATRLELLERYHFENFLRHPPSSARSRYLVGRLQHRAPACGARCVGVEDSGWLIWPNLFKVLWALGGKVAPKEQVVDGYLRQE
jgi:hypothetical protein